jgi:hypothetical protein
MLPLLRNPLGFYALDAGGRYLKQGTAWIAQHQVKAAWRLLQLSKELTREVDKRVGRGAIGGALIANTASTTESGGRLPEQPIDGSDLANGVGATGADPRCA